MPSIDSTTHSERADVVSPSEAVAAIAKAPLSRTAQHELRTPLSALTLQLESMVLELEQASPVDRAALRLRLDKALRHTWRLAHAIETLFDSRPE